MPPNFYYDQEDLLRERQQGKAWHWTALRPEATIGFGLGNPINLGMSIAVYAAISKELGLPLRFPGTEKSYAVLYQITSADILAKATTWAGLSEAAKNEIFNITNGDYFRWRYLWPRIAAVFDMSPADPSRRLLRGTWRTRSLSGRLLSGSMVCSHYPRVGFVVALRRRHSPPHGA